MKIGQIDIYEDFAWSIDTEVEGQELFLLLGYVDDDCEWLLQIHKYRGLLDLLRKQRLACASRLWVAD